MKFGSWRTFLILKVTRMLLYLWKPKSFLHFFNICCIFLPVLYEGPVVIFQVIHSCKRRIVSKKLENWSCLPVSHKNRSAFWGYLVVAAGERWSQWHSSLVFWFKRRTTFARIFADFNCYKSVLQESRLETQSYYRKTSILGGCWYYAFAAVITTTKTTTTSSASKNNRFFGAQEWRPFCKEVLQAEITHYAAITYRSRFVANIATKMHSRGLSVIQEHRTLRASDEFFWREENWALMTEDHVLSAARL